MSPTSATVWLASYPKSGNTWVRAQLSTLESGSAQALKKLSRSREHDRMSTSLGVPLGDLSPAETAAVLRLSWTIRDPGHHGYLRRKTHRAWTPAADGFPVPWQPPHARAIYIVRDPRAIVASWAHHVGVGFADAVTSMGTAFQPLARLDAHGDQDLMSWTKHVASWLDDCTLPQLVVRYEDMIVEPDRELTRMAEFLDMPHTAESIAAATQACSFTSLAAQEIVEGFSEAGRVGQTFFRRGQADAWKDELPAELIAQVCQDHGPMMRRLSYLT
ncbi:MAG: sulfotransferase domain-containing protein [Candidatus Nanopelagicales bacterium]